MHRDPRGECTSETISTVLLLTTLISSYEPGDVTLGQSGRYCSTALVEIALWKMVLLVTTERNCVS